MNQEKEDLAWLASEPNWANRLGEGWKAVRPLGRGGFGITGHYRYESSSQSGNQTSPYSTHSDIVVKQTLVPGKESDGLGGAYYEGEYLALFAGNENNNATPHIIQLLGGPFTDTGNDTMNFDKGKVERIYLEFMPNGNLHDYVFEELNFLNEKAAWSLFHCLAKACLAMDRGCEDIEGEPWEKTQVWHNDIKADNVFLGLNDEGEHKDFLFSKLADFGLSDMVPDTEEEMHEYVAQKQRSNPFFNHTMPPELGLNTLLTYEDGVYESDRPVLGTPSNIWQIGWLMYNLLRSVNDLEIEDYEEGFVARFGKLKERQGVTFGQGLLDNDSDPFAASGRFSKSLRKLIMECLMGEPDLRPGVEDLVERTRRHEQASAASGPPPSAPGNGRDDGFGDDDEEDRAAAARARDRQRRGYDEYDEIDRPRKQPQGQQPPQSSHSAQEPSSGRKIAPLPSRQGGTKSVKSKRRTKPTKTPRKSQEGPKTPAKPRLRSPPPRAKAPRQKESVGAEPGPDPYYPPPSRQPQRTPKADPYNPPPSRQPGRTPRPSQETPKAPKERRKFTSPPPSRQMRDEVEDEVEEF